MQYYIHFPGLTHYTRPKECAFGFILALFYTTYFTNYIFYYYVYIFSILGELDEKLNDIKIESTTEVCLMLIQCLYNYIKIFYIFI